MVIDETAARVTPN